MTIGLQPLSWTTELYTVVRFHHQYTAETVSLAFGLCSRTSRLNGYPFHWARVLPISPDLLRSFHLLNWETQEHDCQSDHVDPEQAEPRDFGDAARSVRLSFSRCPFSPDTTIVFLIELRGTVYEHAQRSEGLLASSPVDKTSSRRDEASPWPSARPDAAAVPSIPAPTRRTPPDIRPSLHDRTPTTYSTRKVLTRQP